MFCGPALSGLHLGTPFPPPPPCKTMVFYTVCWQELSTFCLTQYLSWHKNSIQFYIYIKIWCSKRIVYNRNPRLTLLEYLATLKGLSHEIFWPVFWPLRMYLGLNVNQLWLLNCNDAPLILDNYFKFWCASGQTFSEILRISENVWQLSLRFSNFQRLLVSGSLRNAA